MNDMAKEIYFFYDESGHSRKITSDTMNSDGFRNYFISAIIGVEKMFIVHLSLIIQILKISGSPFMVILK